MQNSIKEQLKMVRILYLINTIKEAGAQKHLLEVINTLDKKEFSPWLAVLDGNSTVGMPAKIPVINLNVKRIYGPSGIKGLFKLIKLIKEERFDIVHSYLFTENILGAIAAKIAKVPVIITGRRDTGMLYQKKNHYIWAYRLTNRFVDKIICVSEAVRKAIIHQEKLPLRKTAVIYNGVDVNKFNGTFEKEAIRNQLGINKEGFVISIIANFSWIKGHSDFIKAAKLITEEIPNIKFLLIGDGALKENIQSLVQDYGLENKVIFLGSRKDIPELLSITDISVNASYSEGMSNTILESMASGVPVVATAVDGNLETVIDGVTGLLVPPKNPEAMAEAIIKILQNKQLAKEMGQNARKTIEKKFTSEIMIKNMQDFYKQLLKPKVAFIFSQFPCYDETFIMREMNTLKASGLNFVIYSIKRCKDKIIHKEAKTLIENTYYLPLFSLRLILINLFFLIRHPIRYLDTFLVVFFGNIKSPNFFIKSVASWMQAVGFAWKAQREKITHVHGQWATFPATHAYIMSKLTGIPFSFTGHAHDIYVDTAMLAKKINEAEFITTCTANNKEYLSKLLGGYADKIIVNYHGVEIERFKTENEPIDQPTTEKLRILSVGSLLECKGFDVLIDACRILKDKGIDFECTIAGGGPLENKLRKQTIDLGLKESVKFTGYITQDKLIPLYQQADVFSLNMRSRIHWGIPNVLLEAIAAGAVVICTHLPSIPELIENNKTGFVVPEENPQAVADLLIKLYQDEELRNQIVENSIKIVEEKFNAEKNARNLITLFNNKGNIPNQLSVLYAIPTLELGGAERVVINLAKELDKNKFKAMVCCLNQKGKFADELEKVGIEVIALGKKGGFDFSVISKLIKVIRENKIDIVHTHLWGANFWGRIAAKIAKVPVIIATEHNEDIWKPPLYFLFDNILADWSDKVVAVSNKVKEFYVNKGIRPDQIEVIYNGIEARGQAPALRLRSGQAGTVPDLKNKLGIKEDDITLAVIGRLVPQKGHRYFLSAVKEIIKNHMVKALIVGSGPIEEELKQYSYGLGLDGNVIFTGLRRDIPELLDNCIDILIMPSLREGLPIVALEAMAAGVPIIASKVGGIPELVIDGGTGLLVEPRNHTALKESIERLINDKGLRQQLIANAKRKIEEDFSLTSMINKTQGLYENLYRLKNSK